MEPLLDRSGALSVSVFGTGRRPLVKIRPGPNDRRPRGPSSNGGNLAAWYLAWRRSSAEYRRKQALETRPPPLCRNGNSGQLWPPHQSFANPPSQLPEPFGSLCVALCRKQACCMDAYLRLVGRHAVCSPSSHHISHLWLSWGAANVNPLSWACFCEASCGRPRGLRLRGCFRQLHQAQTWLQSFHPSIHPASLRAWPTMIRGGRRGRATRARLPQNRQQPTSLAINRHRASHHRGRTLDTWSWPGGWSIGIGIDIGPSVLTYLLH
jgi:hypothetical protein